MTLSARTTPVLGWNSWNAVRCNVTEDLVLANADALVRTGLRDKGYRHVVVDDCWQDPTRVGGRLRAHPERFPSGIDWLAAELARRGLELGLYLAPGRRTCAEIYDRYGQRGGLGSFGHEEQDLEQVLEWGVTYLKLDWCRAHVGTGLEPATTVRRWSRLIDAAPQEVVLSISEYGRSQPWEWAPGLAHSWRTTQDISPRWRRMLWIARRTQLWSDYARPGAVGDPDMLEVGNGQLVGEAGRTHLAIWAMLAAPLMIGTDLTRATPETIQTLGDERLLSLDQDPLVRAGRLVRRHRGIDVWSRTTTQGEISLIVNTGRRRRKVDLVQSRVELPGRGSVLLEHQAPERPGVP